MRYKRRLLTLAILVILLVAGVSYFPGHLDEYSQYIFYPFQSVRNSILGYFPVSFGDVFYFLGGVWLLTTVIRWIYFIIHFKVRKEQLGGSVIGAINTVLFVYLLFYLGWGANYNKPPLRAYWKLGESQPSLHGTDSIQARKQMRVNDSIALISFDSFLVDKINEYAPHYHNLTFHITNERAKAYYRICTDGKVKDNGLEVKPSLYSYVIEHMAIDGYYNPFTGEGQVNDNLPGFELPFVICHEMAHQAGIAAEDDANLMAYALGTMVNDTSFNYSSYLNIWLYTNNRVYHRDSLIAKAFEEKLNKLTQLHIDTLDQISRKYNNTMTHYSGELYDSYLKMQAQKEGIRSYGNVVRSAWELEEKRKSELQAVIKMP